MLRPLCDNDKFADAAKDLPSAMAIKRLLRKEPFVDAPRRADRRTFLKGAAVSAIGCAARIARGAAARRSGGPRSLFDGKSLDGWFDVENSAASFGKGDISDLAALSTKLTAATDSPSAYLSAQIDASLKARLAAYSPAEAPADTAALATALAKLLNQVISGPPLSQAMAFRSIRLRPETDRLVNQNPKGSELVRLNRMILEDAFPQELAKGAATGWIVKDGAMASTGAGRGVIYSAEDFARFRLTFSVRHVSGNPDHQACVLIFCTRPRPGELPLDALAGIQFQVPKGGHWDYRPGRNDAGNDEFTNLAKPQFDPADWSRVEILADAAAGTARMAVAQPLGSKAVGIVSFKNAQVGKAGPIALQMHNAGLFDEYKDIEIEENPATFEMVTTNG